MKFGRIILVIIEFWKKEKNLPQNLHCSVNHQVKEKKQKKRSNSKFKKKIASNFSIIENFEKKKRSILFLWNFETKFVSFIPEESFRGFWKKKKKELVSDYQIVKNINWSCLIRGMQTQRRWLFDWFDRFSKELMKNLLLVWSNQCEQLICKYYCVIYLCDHFFLQCKPMTRRILSVRLVDSQKFRV